MTPGEVLAWVTGVGGLSISMFTLFSKGRETSWSQAAALRAELQSQIDELREEIRTRDTDLADARARLTAVEAQLAASLLEHRTLLDYVRDVTGGQYDLDWCKRRGTELLARLTPKGPT
ncbi:hypothetical protein [Deinococcus sp. DB0503]|uniref:hypothetical protein n=1 Tax=Deinococcus sp. DB0503 TaxID=2479203 RepID=UPI0018DFDE88|nr:hypothetical protein [Deinococcus sp. DB0503]MBI0447136.1 hypothetical protein [Deinococcus sp. DB0503]